MESIYKGSAGAIFIFMSTVYRKSKNMSQPGVAGHRLRSAEGVAKNVSHLSRRQLYWHRALGRVEGALLEGKTWKIPSTAEKPDRKPRHSSAEETLLAFLKREKEASLKGGSIIKFRLTLLIIRITWKVHPAFY